MTGQIPSNERGAVATLVAVLATMGVLLGILAIGVDVGNLMWERRQLQNGADAASLALAETCAQTDTCGPDTVLLPLLADGNAHDGESDLDPTHYPYGQCGNGVTGLPDCDEDLNGPLSMCPVIPTQFAGLPYVQVHTVTKSNDSTLRQVFAGAVGASDDSTVRACARTMWGSPGSTGATFPLTIGLCDWYLATDKGFAPGPPYSPAPATPQSNPSTPVPASAAPYVWHIFAHSTGNASTPCGSTKFAPGGFGWLKDAGGCTAVFGATGPVSIGSTGASPDGTCKDDMQKYLGQEVLIPVFSDVTGSGAGTQYILAGISSFYLAGWGDVPSAKPAKTTSIYKEPTYLPDSTDKFCEAEGKKATCIWGWFTSPVVPLGTINTSVPDRGPTVIQMGG